MLSPSCISSNTVSSCFPSVAPFSQQYGGLSPSSRTFGTPYVDQIDQRKQGDAAWMSYLNSAKGQNDCAQLGITLSSAMNPDDVPLSLRRNFMQACPTEFNSTSGSIFSGSMPITSGSSQSTNSTISVVTEVSGDLQTEANQWLAHADNHPDISSLSGAGKVDDPDVLYSKNFPVDSNRFTVSHPINPNSKAALRPSPTDQEPAADLESPKILVNGWSVDDRPSSTDVSSIRISLFSPSGARSIPEETPSLATVLTDIGFAPLGLTGDNVKDDKSDYYVDHESEPKPFFSSALRRSKDTRHAWRRARTFSKYHRRAVPRPRSAWIGDALRDRFESLSPSSLWTDFSSVRSRRSRAASSVSTYRESDARPSSRSESPASITAPGRRSRSTPAATTAAISSIRNQGRKNKSETRKRRANVPKRSVFRWPRGFRRRNGRTANSQN